MIELRQVTKVYSPRKRGQQIPVRAVEQIDLQIEPGDFLVITGRSGCGKTTLLNLIAGLARPNSGEVFVDGIDIWAMKDEALSALRNQKMGFMFQVPSLMPTLNVLDNVVVPTMFAPREKQRDAYQRARQALESVGLSHRMEAFPHHLSAGEEKRVVIARAIINNPPVLLADEPTANLDELTEKEVMALLQKIHGQGRTIILVTHHPGLIGYGTRHLTMSDGKFVA
jgi:ABC-type lipoprotein export system ATPase subunit